jgi:hypothetical protein
MPRRIPSHAPVSLHIKIAEIEFVLKSETDRRGAARYLSCREDLASKRRKNRASSSLGSRYKCSIRPVFTHKEETDKGHLFGFDRT